MSKKKMPWLRPIKLTIALKVMSLAIVMSGSLLSVPAAEAKEGVRLCYITTEENGAMYFTRTINGTSPRNCSAFYVEYPDGQERRGASDVPTLSGVDYSECENFTKWKFKDLPTNADICDYCLLYTSPSPRDRG